MRSALRRLAVAGRTGQGSQRVSFSTAPMRKGRLLDTKGMVKVSGIKPNGTTKRFYKEVSISPMGDGWTVMLDGRPLITEDKHRFIVPTASAASAIAYEWDVQGERIKPFVMPLMSLAATAIDVDRKKIVGKLLKYVDTDSLCYRVDSPASLAKMQKKFWDPVLNYFRDEHGLTIYTTEGIASLSQPAETKLEIARFIDETSNFELACLKAVAEVGYSTMLGIAVVHRKVSMKDTYNAAMAERLFQVRKWGEVKGPYGHGIELEYPRLHIASAINFLNFIHDDFAPLASKTTVYEES